MAEIAGNVGLVGAAGIEPATICSQSRYATAALRPGGKKVSHGSDDRKESALVD